MNFDCFYILRGSSCIEKKTVKHQLEKLSKVDRIDYFQSSLNNTSEVQMKS